MNLKTKTDEKTPVLLYHAYCHDKCSSFLQSTKYQELSKQVSRATTNPASTIIQSIPKEINFEGYGYRNFFRNDIFRICNILRVH